MPYYEIAQKYPTIPKLVYFAKDNLDALEIKNSVFERRVQLAPNAKPLEVTSLEDAIKESIFLSETAINKMRKHGVRFKLFDDNTPQTYKTRIEQFGGWLEDENKYVPITSFSEAYAHAGDFLCVLESIYFGEITEELTHENGFEKVFANPDDWEELIQTLRSYFYPVPRHYLDFIDTLIGHDETITTEPHAEALAEAYEIWRDS